MCGVQRAATIVKGWLVGWSTSAVSRTHHHCHHQAIKGQTAFCSSTEPSPAQHHSATRIWRLSSQSQEIFTGDPSIFTRNKGSKWVTIVAILLSLSPSFSISNLPCRIQGANTWKGLTTTASLWFCWSPHDQLSPQVGNWTNCSCFALTHFWHALSLRGLQVTT